MNGLKRKNKQIMKLVVICLVIIIIALLAIYFISKDKPGGDIDETISEEIIATVPDHEVSENDIDKFKEVENSKLKDEKKDSELKKYMLNNFYITENGCLCSFFIGEDDEKGRFTIEGMQGITVLDLGEIDTYLFQGSGRFTRTDNMVTATLETVSRIPNGITEITFELTEDNSLVMYDEMYETKQAVPGYAFDLNNQDKESTQWIEENLIESAKGSFLSVTEVFSVPLNMEQKGIELTDSFSYSQSPEKLVSRTNSGLYLKTKIEDVYGHIWDMDITHDYIILYDGAQNYFIKVNGENK